MAVHVDANVVCVCGGGPFFLAIHRQFVKPAVEARAQARGTAGAPPWLINVAARTSSPPEWRQRPHNAQPVCYACLSLSVDCGPAPVLSWGSRGAKREVGTQTNYHFMTKRFFCRRYIIDLPFRGRSLWSGFGRLGLKGGKMGLASVVHVLIYKYNLQWAPNEEKLYNICRY